MAKPTDADQPLKRLGGGRWASRDERFTIEPQSGTWVVVDAEQTDDLGLPLVRGPFSSLTAAKAAIASARTEAPAISPLAPRPSTTSAVGSLPTTATPPAATARMKTPGPPPPTTAPAPEPARSVLPPPQPSEPRWLTDLAPDDRRRARHLIRALEEAGARDAENIVRRDLEGGVPAVAAWALAQALADLGDGATTEDVARLLADGRDAALGVRWRLVDGDGRPVVIPRPTRATDPSRTRGRRGSA